MTQRLSTSSNGRGPALTAVIADRAARNPKIRRVWACEAPVPQAVAVALELQPVADSEETSAVWLAARARLPCAARSCGPPGNSLRSFVAVLEHSRRVR